MKFSKEILKGAAELIVLSSLKRLESAYGYELIKHIENSSENIFEFQEGTLYPLLYRLEIKGLLESEEKQAENGKKRRYYFLTSEGKKYIKEKQKEYSFFIKGIKKFMPEFIHFI